MRRREFIAPIGGSALASHVPASAQQPENMRRICILIHHRGSDQKRNFAFLEQLQRFGDRHRNFAETEERRE